jgi:hypothetical protein
VKQIVTVLKRAEGVPDRGSYSALEVDQVSQLSSSAREHPVEAVGDGA